MTGSTKVIITNLEIYRRKTLISNKRGKKTLVNSNSRKLPGDVCIAWNYQIISRVPPNTSVKKTDRIIFFFQWSVRRNSWEYLIEVILHCSLSCYISIVFGDITYFYYIFQLKLVFIRVWEKSGRVAYVFIVEWEIISCEKSVGNLNLDVNWGLGNWKK